MKYKSLNDNKWETLATFESCTSGRELYNKLVTLATIESCTSGRELYNKLNPVAG